MTGDRDRGVKALQIYYSDSEIDSVMSFNDFVAYYDAKSPSFIENLGAAIRQSELTSDRLHEAFQKIIAQNNSALPHHTTFFSALSDNVQDTFRFETLKAVAVDTITDVKNTAVAGLAAYGLWIVLGLVATVVVTNYLPTRRARS